MRFLHIRGIYSLTMLKITLVNLIGSRYTNTYTIYTGAHKTHMDKTRSWQNLAIHLFILVWFLAKTRIKLRRNLFLIKHCLFFSAIIILNYNSLSNCSKLSVLPDINSIFKATPLHTYTEKLYGFINTKIFNEWKKEGE